MAQDFIWCSRQVDNGALASDTASPAIDHSIDLAVEIGKHLVRRFRAWCAGWVRRGCGERQRTAAQQRLCLLLLRAAQTDGSPARRHDGGYAIRRLDDDGERSRPKSLRQRIGAARHVAPIALECLRARDHEAQRLHSGSTLDLVQAAHSALIQPVCGQPIDRLRRHGDKSAAAYQRRRRLDILRQSLCFHSPSPFLSFSARSAAMSGSMSRSSWPSITASSR